MKFAGLFLIGLGVVDGAKTLPPFPKQFKATVVTIAHQVDRTKEYPPWKQVLEVSYDFPALRARVNGVEGFHANQLFLERYDTKNEYMVRSGEFEECQRSYLSESLPVPEYPSSAKYVDDVSIDDFDCEHWVAAHGSDSRRHIYIRTVREKVSKATLAGFGSSCGSNGRADDTMLCEVRIPYQLVDEYILAESQLSQPVMTYTLHNLTIGSPPAADFELPAPYTHKQCKRHIGGQPYFHLFSSYFMV